MTVPRTTNPQNFTPKGTGCNPIFYVDLNRPLGYAKCLLLTTLLNMQQLMCQLIFKQIHIEIAV